MKVAMLLSCSSFEGFFGQVQRQTRESYLKNYRNDWVWYYAQGFIENGLTPIIYIPSLFETGIYETDVGVSVRFLKIENLWHPFEHKWIKKGSRISRWTLYLDETLSTLAFRQALVDGLAQDQIDIVYIQEYWSARFDILSRLLTYPVVGADHGGVSDRVVKLFKSKALGAAAACYAQTRDECRIVEAYGGKAILAPNGCDLETFYPDHSIVRQKTILSVARLTDKQKRTSDLIHALKLLPEDWTLDIVGTGPDEAMLRQLALRLGLESRVRFHGFVGRHEIRRFFRECGAYAMPSSNEAVALAALEAMACGAPVVLSRIRAFEQLVQDGVDGLLIPVGNPPALATAIQTAWENREALGMAAYETVKSDYDRRVLYARVAQSLQQLALQHQSIR